MLFLRFDLLPGLDDNLVKACAVFLLWLSAQVEVQRD